MKKIKIYLVIALSFTGFISCNNWLTLYPDNAQTTAQYWQSKQDVESVTAAGYVQLRECIKDQSLFIWGEMRGECIDIVNSTANDNIKAAQKIRNEDIDPTNMYASWANLYKVIGMANSVLKYAPSVREVDPSFSLEEMNGYFSEVYFLRALAYFYLVRIYKEVPLILEPYVEDTKPVQIAKSDEATIINQIILDLKAAIPSAKTFYPETDDTNPMNTKGRATIWSIYALLADVYLWRGDDTQNDYQSCIDACNRIMNSGTQFRLVTKDEWYSIFYPGNSDESIFEVQFNYTKNKQTNDFITWFGGKAAQAGQLYGISLSAELLFNETALMGDVRGFGASYDGLGRIWKYLGYNFTSIEPAVRNATTENDQNFIIYRLADIYLMQAEAYIMKGDFVSATNLIAQIRQRAGIIEMLTPPQNESDMLDLLLNERAREFLGEGKRWFDLLRVARRHDYQYKEYMIDHVLEAISPGYLSIARAKLADPNAHYLPIYKDEIVANKLLVQNPYYATFGN